MGQREEQVVASLDLSVWEPPSAADSLLTEGDLTVNPNHLPPPTPPPPTTPNLFLCSNKVNGRHWGRRCDPGQLVFEPIFHFSTVTDNVYFTRWESAWKKNLYPSHDYVPVLLFLAQYWTAGRKNHLNVTFHFQAWQQDPQNQHQRVHKSSWSLWNTIEMAAPGWNLSSKQARFWSFRKHFLKTGW